MKKELNLIVMEGNVPVKRPFAEIELDYPITQSNIVNPTFTLDPEISWNGISRGHYPSLLVKDYLKTVEEIQQLSQEIARRDRNFSLSDLYEKILATDFSYASSEAYDKRSKNYKKEKENDFEQKGRAHYLSPGSIVVSLPTCCSSETIRNSTIHEHGHLMHQLLDPHSFYRNLRQKDRTMLETMAIFVQEELNVNRDYRRKTPHGRAQDLLAQLNQTDFKKLSFADRWTLLSHVSSHEKALDEISAATSKHF